MDQGGTRRMNRHIFREYDIRGIFGQDLTEEAVTTLGKAMGAYLRSQDIAEVVVGRDCRLSSDDLFEWLTRGLLASGFQVIDIGMVPTPVLYFAVHHFGHPAGIMITGSHNPPDYNGFKVQVGDLTIYGEEIQKIHAIAEAGNFVAGKGSMREEDALTPYDEYMIRDIKLERRDLRFVVDCGNGAASVIAPRVMKDLGLHPTLLYCEPDGRFPNHHPDPTVPANLEDLIRIVKESGSDLGIAYDGDADRIGVVDSRGEILWGDRLLIIFSREIIKENPGASVLGEVKCSQVLYDDIRAHGGRPIMWKTGHSLIKAKMKETGALIGGEMSGHMFFRHRYFGFDDAIYASLRLLELVSRSSGGLGALASGIPDVVVTPEIRVECPEDKKFQIVEKLQKTFKARKDVTVIDIDGARVHYAEGWGLVRASNTQPVLVMRFEASSRENLEKIRKDMESVLERIKNE
jgi:phosphomannomutase/phosphoglucomutase